MVTAIDERDALLQRGDELWGRLRRALDRHLSEPLAPSTDWTGHDVYGHFARWQANTIADVRRLIVGSWERREDEDEDVINDRWRDEDRDVPADVLRKRCLSSRQELRSLLCTLDEKQWALFGRAASADINGEHYLHHLRVAGLEPDA